jgi:heterodisulfide reductase subunit A-like polyferredoxin
MKWVFAGGDAFYGPKSVVDAVACGKEAAESIHRFINGMDLTEGRQKEWEFVKPDVINEPHKDRTVVRCLDPAARECNSLEVSFAQAVKTSDRCLKCGICPNAISASRHVWQVLWITTRPWLNAILKSGP